MRRRAFAAAAAFLGAVGLVATVAGLAVAANPPPLNGEDLPSNSGTADYSSCVAGSGGVVTFSASDNTFPVGQPYPGTFTASGSETLDTSAASVVTALSGTFTIHDATDGIDISGTLSLDPPSTGWTVNCSQSIADVNYTATITTASTTCTDTGTAHLATDDAQHFDLFNFQSTSLNCGSASPQSSLGQISTELAALLGQPAPQPAQQKIQEASTKLAQAQASPAWISDSELNPQTGKQVFNGIQKAMVDSSEAARMAKTLAPQLTAIKQEMKDATVPIAETARQEALALLPTATPDEAAKAQRELNIAQQFEQKGVNQPVTQGNAGDLIQKLQESWSHSEKALQIIG